MMKSKTPSNNNLMKSKSLGTLSDINDLKYSFLKQQKYSTELELSLIDLKMQREETPEVLDELLKQKKEAKLKNIRKHIEIKRVSRKEQSKERSFIQGET